MNINNHKKVSISSLNVKGLRGNLVYSKYLSLISSISFFCELWTRPNEVNLIKDLASYSNKNFLYKSDMDYTYTKGRPFGGQCWLIDKKFKLLENRFVNKHLSYIYIKIDSFELVVLGLYLPFYDSKKPKESKSMFELSLTLARSIAQEFKSRNIPVILAGDFNADLNRNNKFDIILRNFIKDNNIFVLENQNKAQNSFTFKSSLINDTYYTSNIDHFLFYGSHIPPSLINPVFMILSDAANLSDHNPINLSFDIAASTNESNKSEKPAKKHLNLENSTIREFLLKKLITFFMLRLMKLSRLISKFKNTINKR